MGSKLTIFLKPGATVPVFPDRIEIVDGGETKPEMLVADEDTPYFLGRQLLFGKRFRFHTWADMMEGSRNGGRHNYLSWICQPGNAERCIESPLSADELRARAAYCLREGYAGEPGVAAARARVGGVHARAIKSRARRRYRR
jgi:hypothetical protein